MSGRHSPQTWTSIRLSIIANSIYPYTFDGGSVPTHDLAVLEPSTSLEDISGSQTNRTAHMAHPGAPNILIGYVSLFSRFRPEGSFLWFHSQQNFTKSRSDTYDPGHREKFWQSRQAGDIIRPCSISHQVIKYTEQQVLAEGALQSVRIIDHLGKTTCVKI